MQPLKTKIKLFFIAVFLTAAFGCEKGKGTVAHQLPETPETVPAESIAMESPAIPVEEPPLEADSAPAEKDWERPTHFAPLADNERFAYSVREACYQESMPIYDMTVYAVRNNDIHDIKELFSWESVRHFGREFQFTEDLKIFYFLEYRWLNTYWSEQDLYVANGFTGTIKKLIPNIIGIFRLTDDGRHIAFLHYYREFDPKNNIMLEREEKKADIVIFDIENETMRHFEWQTKSPVVDAGWILRKFGNNFRIFALTDEARDIIAEAELNPSTMELNVLWDMSDPADRIQPLQAFQESPYVADDASDIFRNPNIMISPNPEDYNPNK